MFCGNVIKTCSEALPWNRTHIPAGISVEEVVKGLMLEFQDQISKYKREGGN